MSAVRLLRSVHDASVDIDPAGPWRSRVHEPAEVICHNDFATYNLVFSDGEVVGVIDWDFASPGPRLWDLAYLAYRLVPLSCVDRADGFSDEQRHKRLDRLLVAYGTDATAHSDLGPAERIQVNLMWNDVPGLLIEGEPNCELEWDLGQLFGRFGAIGEAS